MPFDQNTSTPLKGDIFGIRFWIVAVELENLQIRFGVCNVSAMVCCLDSAKMVIILYVHCCEISDKKVI